MSTSIHTTIKAFLVAVCLAVPTAMMADTMTETMYEEFAQNQPEMEQNQIMVSASRMKLQVKNAEGQTMEVFNLIGDKVYTQRIEAQSKSFDLGQLPHGYYIVKIGNFSRKVYLH